MNVEEFRDYCLSLPDVTEAIPFEKMSRDRFTILVFYIRGHIFCYFKVEDFSNITIKCNPSDISELIIHLSVICLAGFSRICRTFAVENGEEAFPSKLAYPKPFTLGIIGDFRAYSPEHRR